MSKLIVTDLNGNTEMLTDYKDFSVKGRVNGERSLSFLLLSTDRNEHSFSLVKEESKVEYNGQEYRIKSVSERALGNRSVKQVKADHVFFDLIDEYQYDTKSGTLTIQQALDHVLTWTGFTYSVIDSFDSVEFKNFGDDNATALLQKILERYQAEIDIDNTHLEFKTQIGRTTDIQFRYKHNLKAIEKSINTESLSTYIKGYGKQNEDGTYVVTATYESPNSSIYGKRHAKPVRDERYTTEAGLLERLKQEIQDEPEISFKIDFVELKKAGYDYERIYLGDEIFVIYEPLGIDITARIIAYEEYPEEIKNSNVTLANFKDSATDIMADLARTKSQVDKAIDDSGNVRYNVLDEAVKRATEAIKNAQTELTYPTSGGIHAVDPADANRYVAFTSAGLGITVDGGTTFPQAITPDGIVADAGVVGQFKANNIKVGVGTTFDENYNPTEKEKAVIRKTTAPTDTSVLWLDTSVTPNIWKVHNGSAWVKATPTEANEIKAADGATVETKTSKINSDGTLPTTSLSGVIDVATNKVNSSSNFYWDANGLIASDPNDTNNIVKLTSGGLGISSDGGTSYDNAITGAGIVASKITVGKLEENQIASSSKWNIEAKKGTNLLNWTNADLPNPYSYVTIQLPDGSKGKVIKKKHVGGSALDQTGLYFPEIEVDPTKTYLLEVYVKAMDTNSQYYYGREEYAADGSENDQGNGPYIVGSETTNRPGEWVKHYAFIPPHNAGTEGSHTTDQSTITPDTEYKFWDANTTKIKPKIFLTYGVVDTSIDSTMYAYMAGCYEVGSGEGIITELSKATSPNVNLVKNGGAEIQTGKTKIYGDVIPDYWYGWTPNDTYVTFTRRVNDKQWTISGNASFEIRATDGGGVASGGVYPDTQGVYYIDPINNVSEGDKYTLSALVGAHRCDCFVQIRWQIDNGDGTYSYQYEMSNTQSKMEPRLLSVTVTVPANTVGVRAHLTKHETKEGNVNSYGFFDNVKFEKGSIATPYVEADTTTTDIASESYDTKVLTDGWKHATDTTLIDGGKIYTGSVTANQISVNSLSAIHADLGSVTAGSLTGVTITGSTIQTSSTSPKIELSGSTLWATNGTYDLILDPDPSSLSSPALIFGTSIADSFITGSNGSVTVFANTDLTLQAYGKVNLDFDESTEGRMYWIKYGYTANWYGDIIHNDDFEVKGTFTNSSKREYKDNIREYQESALSKIKGTKVKKYNHKHQKNRGDTIGLIQDESPSEIVYGEGIDLYAMNTLLWKAIQELEDKINDTRTI